MKIAIILFLNFVHQIRSLRKQKILLEYQILTNVNMSVIKMLDVEVCS